MFDFEDIEKKLNSDENFRKKFLADPVSTLRAKGVKLSSFQATNLRQCVSKLRAKPSGKAFPKKLSMLGFKVEVCNIWGAPHGSPKGR